MTQVFESRPGISSVQDDTQGTASETWSAVTVDRGVMGLPMGNGSVWDVNATGIPQDGSRVHSHHAYDALEMVTLALVMALSTAGNVVVLYVVARYLHFKTVTNLFIVSLAVSDLLTTLVCMTMTLGQLAGAHWLQSADVCVINGFLNSALGVVATFMTTFITIDRYFVVVKLPKGVISVKLACLVVAASWVLAGFCGFPWHLVVSGSSQHDAYSEQGYHHCMYIFHVKTSPDGLIYSLLFILVCYAIPGACISYCTVAIWKTVRLNESRVRPASTHVNQLRFSGELRTAKTVLLIVIFFFTCRLPYSVLGVGFAISQRKMSIPLDTIAMWLFWSNCAVTPVIYAVRNPVLAEALHLNRVTGYERRQLNKDTAAGQQHHGAKPLASAADSEGGATYSAAEGSVSGSGTASSTVNSSDIAVSLTRSDHRSDSIPSVLLFSAVSRKGSSQSTATTSTNV